MALKFLVFGAALGCSGVVFATGDLSLIRVVKQFYTEKVVHRTRH